MPRMGWLRKQVFERLIKGLELVLGSLGEGLRRLYSALSVIRKQGLPFMTGYLKLHLQREQTTAMVERGLAITPMNQEREVFGIVWLGL